jgi:hypothetical protein
VSIRRSTALAVLPGAVVFLVARVPSLMEPRWYTDEAGYASTARSLLRGQRLYSGIWTNKPPLQILLVAIPVAIDQRSELLLHVLSLTFGAAAMAAAITIATRLLTPVRAGLAIVVAGFFLGIPIVDAELALPEGLLIAPVCWAAAIVLLRICRGEGPIQGTAWAVGAGALAAAAIAIQQTAVADACALGLLLVISPRTTARQRIAYIGTVAGITAAWLLTVVILAGPGTVAYALAGFYVQYSAKVLPGTASGLGGHAAILAVTTAAIAVSAFVLRRSQHPAWALSVWAGAALLVPASAQQNYPHFLTPSVIPGALLLASLPVERLLKPAALTARVAVASTAVALVVALVLARSAGLDWVSPDHPLAVSDPHTVPWYYGEALGRATGLRSYTEWETGFDSHATADTEAANWINSHGYARHTAVIWSSDVWVYLLADLPVLMPTPPIYNDEVLLGFGGPVADRVAALSPDLVITADDSVDQYPEITPLLHSRYRQVLRSGSDTVWLRQDLPV